MRLGLPRRRGPVAAWGVVVLDVPDQAEHAVRVQDAVDFAEGGCVGEPVEGLRAFSSRSRSAAMRRDSIVYIMGCVHQHRVEICIKLRRTKEKDNRWSHWLLLRQAAAVNEDQD